MIKFVATLAVFAATVAPAASQSIIDLAAADGKYGTLLSAVTNTPGVLDAITDNMPVTIFAPTDSAFGDVSETVASLDEGALATVLASHVVEGVYRAQDVISAGCVELRSLSGANLRVAYEGGKVRVNDSTVVQADIVGDGGVIHGLNKVILPDTFRPCGAAAKGTKKGSKKSAASYEDDDYYDDDDDSYDDDSYDDDSADDDDYDDDYASSGKGSGKGSSSADDDDYDDDYSSGKGSSRRRRHRRRNRRVHY